jgi:phage terminase small subunit
LPVDAMRRVKKALMTKAPKRPKPPRNLDAAGKQIWKALQADLPDDWEMTAREVELLHLAARQADLVAELEEALAEEGITVAGAAGQRRMNAVATELRQSRIALARLLGEIEMPEGEDEEPTTAQRVRARRAAQARWRRRKAA